MTEEAQYILDFFSAAKGDIWDIRCHLEEHAPEENDKKKLEWVIDQAKVDEAVANFLKDNEELKTVKVIERELGITAA